MTRGLVARRWRIVAPLVLSIGAMGSPACATVEPSTVARAVHEIDDRFTVLGYVRDAQGRPVVNGTITLVREKTGLAYYGDTDTSGLFLVIVELGDEGVGETLRLTADTGAAGPPPRTTRISVQFDPTNESDERGTRVDLDGDRWIERSGAFQSTLTHVLAAPPRE